MSQQEMIYNFCTLRLQSFNSDIVSCKGGFSFRVLPLKLECPLKSHIVFCRTIDTYNFWCLVLACPLQPASLVLCSFSLSPRFDTKIFIFATKNIIDRESVCVREGGETQRERDRERQTETERGRERVRGRQRQRQKETKRDRERQRDKEREIERER